MDTALTPILQKNLGIFENLKELNSIDMYPDSVDRLKASQILLQAKPEIAHLCVSNGFEYSNEVPEDLHDSSTRHGLLSRTLFSHMQPFETCKPYCLSSLDLDTVELRVRTIITRLYREDRADPSPSMLRILG